MSVVTVAVTAPPVALSGVYVVVTSASAFDALIVPSLVFVTFPAASDTLAHT